MAMMKINYQLLTIKAAEREGFEPPNLQFRRLGCYPVTPHSQVGRAGVAPATENGRFYRPLPALIGEPTQEGMCSTVDPAYYTTERTGLEPAMV